MNLICSLFNLYSHNLSYLPTTIIHTRSNHNHLIDSSFTADATEKRLINEVYDFAKSIAELQLSESELALYSALVLLQPGKFVGSLHL